jgi:hypothetical protein
MGRTGSPASDPVAGVVFVVVRDMMGAPGQARRIVTWRTWSWDDQTDFDP